ncbi:MAG: putative two-component sensor histidine kinase [Anaerolineaceae bacterium]|nr:MAG: putative two-component sensor histidine kinase [Anaerolineaceae bacterium]
MLLTREELQDRLFALHRASLELVKDVSLETLLERIASLACEQAGAKYAALGVLDEAGKLKRFITVGMTATEIKAIPHPPRGMGLIGALMHAEGNLRLAEIGDDPRSAGFPTGHAEMHSLLGVPIRLADRQLGQIYLTEKIGAPEFTSDDETIIEMLAAYAGAAIENARLYERLQEHDQTLTRRNEELDLLNQTGTALSSSLELDEILNKTLALLMAHFEVEAGEIFLNEGDGETLRLVLHRGEAAEAFWTRNRFKVGEGMIGKAAATRQPVISSHLEKDERFTRQAVIEAGFNQIACIPLLSRGEVVGVLTFATRGRKAISQEEIQLLVSVAAWAGTAIENARLHYNARRLAVLEERERIGMDLHDGIIQSIYGVGLALENARASLTEDPKATEERLGKAMEDLNHTIRDIRNYILDLRPRQLYGGTLVEGITRLVAEFRQNTKNEINLSGPKNDPVTDLPEAHAMALFHICQEALANVAKHAEAQKAGIEVWATSDRVLLEVHDNGRGFDVDKTSKTVGHGLANMQTRVANVGGDIDITSAPGDGTTILAWVPRVPAAHSA